MFFVFVAELCFDQLEKSAGLGFGLASVKSENRMKQLT